MSRLGDNCFFCIRNSRPKDLSRDVFYFASLALHHLALETIHSVEDEVPSLYTACALHEVANIVERLSSRLIVKVLAWRWLCRLPSLRYHKLLTSVYSTLKGALRRGD